MVTLGLTGGIACGKSTVAELLARRGVPVLDADQVSRDLTRPGTTAYTAIVAAFGAAVVAPDGALDRRRLGTRVFRDDAARATLNGILHPRIRDESARRLQALGAQGHGFAVYEASLLVENHLQAGFAGLIVVTAQPALQRARLVARDAAGEEEARARIAAQWPLARKVAEATWVIDNSGSRERLSARVAEVYAGLVLRYGPPAPAMAVQGA